MIPTPIPSLMGDIIFEVKEFFKYLFYGLAVLYILYVIAKGIRCLGGF